MVGATYADVVGGIDQSNNASLDFGDVNTGVDPADDPYANLDVPTGSGCDYDGVQINANQATPVPFAERARGAERVVTNTTGVETEGPSRVFTSSPTRMRRSAGRRPTPSPRSAVTRTRPWGRTAPSARF